METLKRLGIPVTAGALASGARSSGVAPESVQQEIIARIVDASRQGFDAIEHLGAVARAPTDKPVWLLLNTTEHSARRPYGIPDPLGSSCLRWERWPSRARSHI